MRAAPHSVYELVKTRTALFWGVAAQTMLRDEALRLPGGRPPAESATMMVRMLRVALSAEPLGRRPRPRIRAAGRGGDSAAAGHRRARRLPARRARPPRLRGRLPASCSASAATRTRWRPGWTCCARRWAKSMPTRAARRPCCGSRGSRRRSSSAAAARSTDALGELLYDVQDELGGRRAKSSPPAISSGPSATQSGRRGCNRHELPDPLPHRVPLLAAGGRQLERAARQARIHRHAALRAVQRPAGAGVAAARPPRLLRHGGDRVRRGRAARAAANRRAGARGHGAAAGPARGLVEGARDRELRDDGRRAPAADRARAAQRSGGRAQAGDGRSHAARHGSGAQRADPRPLRVPAWRHLRRLHDVGPDRGRRRRLPGLRAPRADAAAAARHRGALRVGLPVRRAR